MQGPGPAGSTSASEPAAAVFAKYRSLLFTIAYELTGSAADAEDVVQDSYLRWAGVDHAKVRAPRAYLAQIATREALNKLRSASRRREQYVGPWLPEPVLTEPDVADDVVLAESVSMAMMVVLETLTPDERAVFVLREVFGFSHAEIAAAVGKKEPAVRQIASRARSHVHARRPDTVSGSGVPADPQVLEKFTIATRTGDLQSLMDVLAPDVVLLSDGGGKKSAALRPIYGADKVARFMIGTVTGKVVGEISVRPALVNSAPGSVVYIDDEADTIATCDLVDGRITTVYLVRNPDKLAGHATLRNLVR